MKKLAIAAAIAASIVAVQANAYQAEVGATVGMVDPDNGDSDTSFGVDGTYYFSPVQANKGPLNEAAFLEHASNINAQAQFADNTQSLGLGVEYFVPNSQFYVAGQVGTTDFENSDNNVTNYAAEVGFLPMSNLLIAAGVTGYDDDNNNSGSDPTLRAKYVTSLSTGNTVNLEGRLGFGDDKTYAIGGDFYFDPTMSVGAEYSGINFDNNNVNDTDTFTLRAKKFFNQQVSLEGSVGFGDNVNTYGIRGAYRF